VPHDTGVSLQCISPANEEGHFRAQQR
jgi:hypothetical protein